MGITLTLRKEFRIEKSISGIEAALDSHNSKTFRVKKNNPADYKISARSSIGIGIISGFRALSIDTNLRLLKVSDNQSSIILKTSLRPELIIVGLAWFAIILVQLMGSEPIPIWVTTVIFPLILLWFGFIYRMQEKSLHDTIERFLIK